MGDFPGVVGDWSKFLIGATATKSLQLCPTLSDPIDGSPLVSPIPGILQARTLEWVAIEPDYLGLNPSSAT